MCSGERYVSWETILTKCFWKNVTDSNRNILVMTLTTAILNNTFQEMLVTRFHYNTQGTLEEDGNLEWYVYLVSRTKSPDESATES